MERRRLPSRSVDLQTNWKGGVMPDIVYWAIMIAIVGSVGVIVS